ncbi:MAG TPA: 5-amino-6-(D-ribitylamino)uracil--L-tyrosine 4-hydroxyphenyl transferase CofH [Methanomicrobiales archaeon]|nr:5-amino-6-(D-ribitylamino)uracil--L-tyrosine 4-hydroxyphenyl transferase CofH [Methanomicrobiales archaeon]
MEASSLLKVRDRGIWDIVAAADEMRERKVGPVVTYVRNQNIHVTNICKNLCGFCGFGKPRGAEGTYFHGKEWITEQARLARERGVTEVCLLSGVHPDFTADSYAEMISWVHSAIPEADIHTASPDEIAWAAKRSEIPTLETIRMLREAGLGTLQGTAAEILVDRVREIICPRKVKTDEWVRIIKEAHHMGIRSTATIMYGSVETEEDRARHLGILREIQDETAGFTELVPLSWLHQNTPLYERGIAPPGATGREDILLFAVSRLFLDNFDHIQIPWQKVGLKVTALGLMSGGDDFGGTMFTDEVSAEAGGETGGYLAPEEMQRIAGDLGRTLRQRTTTYELV